MLRNQFPALQTKWNTQNFTHHCNCGISLLHSLSAILAQRLLGQVWFFLRAVNNTHTHTHRISTAFCALCQLLCPQLATYNSVSARNRRRKDTLLLLPPLQSLNGLNCPCLTISLFILLVLRTELRCNVSSHWSILRFELVSYDRFHRFGRELVNDISS